MLDDFDLSVACLPNQFGCGISKMVGLKKQAFCPRINMLKGNFHTNYFEPLYFLKSCPIFDKLAFFVFPKYNGFL